MKVFFQNGASKSPHVMFGQGHVTGVRLSDGAVSELHIPYSNSSIRLTDVLQRKWWSVICGILFSASTIHSGTCNTAVVSYADRIIAVEEASKPFQLNVVNGLIRGGTWLEDETIHGVHPLDSDVYSFTPFRNKKPLVFNGKQVDWQPPRIPVLMHSYFRCNDWVVFPVMSTRFGNLFASFVGKRWLPLHQAPFEWLLFNDNTNTSFRIKTKSYSDVFHIAKATMIGNDTMVVYASHVHNFEPFLQTQRADCLQFSFQKTTINLTSMMVEGAQVFDDAAGDFPSLIEEDIILINRMTEPSVVFFNTTSDTVVHRTHLAHRIRDVVYDDGHLFYCTTDTFYKCDLFGNIVFHTSIPLRHENFHSCILTVD